MPPLSSLEPYLRPLTGLRADPYRTRAGRSGTITAAGNEAVGGSAPGQVGDTGAGAELDRLFAAESAATRSADLTNYLDKQRAERVPAMFERDDPEGAARTRAIQMSSLRPEVAETPNLDALNALLQFESPMAGQARSRALQERIQGKVQEDAATREAEANFFLSPIAQRQRETAAREGRQNARRTRNDELSAMLDPRVLAAQANETAGRLAVAQAQNPPDYRTLAFQQSAHGRPSTPNPQTAVVSAAPPPNGAPAPGQAQKLATWAEVQAVAAERGMDIQAVTEQLEAMGYVIID